MLFISRYPLDPRLSVIFVRTQYLSLLGGGGGEREKELEVEGRGRGREGRGGEG